MRFTQFGSAIALAGLGRAFLLPPIASTSTADDEIISTLPFEESIANDGRVMEIDCPGCPVGVTDIEGKVHYADAESVLKLNFSIAHNGADQLILNGLQIYPINPSSQAFMDPLTADQLVKSADNSWTYAATPRLGYSVGVEHPVQSTQDELDLVAVHVEIVEVANMFLSGLPTVDLKLLRTASGKLMLGDATITASTNNAVSEPTHGGKECTTLVCKWKAIIAEKLAKLKKGCKGKGKGKGHANLDQVDGPKHHGHHGRPHGRPHGAHRPYRHHRHRHGVARFLKQVVLHVFVPIMIGVLVGVTASLIGMVVGNIVVFVWRALFRRGEQGQYARVQQEEFDVEEDDEVKFLEKQGPPPTYTPADEKTAE